MEELTEDTARYWRQCENPECQKWFGTNRRDQVNCSSECRAQKIKNKAKTSSVLQKRKVVCAVCGKEVVPKQANQRTCGEPACQRVLDIERSKGRNKEKREQKEPVKRHCVICGKEFAPKTVNNICCEEKCRVERKKRKDREKRFTAVQAAIENAPQTLDELIDFEQQKLEDRAGKLLLSQKLQEMAGAKILLKGILEAQIPIEPKVLKEFQADRKKKKKSKKEPETAVLILSDLHMGKKTPTFNIDVFKRRLKGLVEKINEILNDYLREAYEINTLKVICVGDLVDGDSIYKTQPWHLDENVMYQIYRTGVPMLTWMLAEFSLMFDKVSVDFVPGNHGRVGKFEPEELNFDTILAESIKLAMSQFKNVEINVEWDWYKVIDIEGRKFLATHGEIIRMYLNIPWYGMVQKAMRWQGSLPEDWEYLILGHFHVSQDFQWNDIRVLANGSFVSGDDFSLKVLGLQSTPTQHFFGVHPKQGISWQYRLDLGQIS